MTRWIVVLALVATSATAREDDLSTYYEKSVYKATPRYPETVDYCKRLARASRWIHYTTFGTTPQGRDLPLLIADRERRFDPRRMRRGNKVVLMIQAGIHSGEIDGKDAGFMLLRDIATDGKLAGLLDHVSILFIPIFNVDGHERFGPYNRINQNGPVEMGWRTTAQNLNLNRDHLKADAPEMQAWLELFNAWRPDFFIDCHVTDGADYQYVLTYILETHGNMAPSLTEWTRDVYLARVQKAMAGAGYDLSPYVMLKEWSNPKSGLMSWVGTPRFSQGYAALRNRPGLLIETHALKDYETRVTATYHMLLQTVKLLNAEYENLKRAIADAEALTSSAEFRAEPFPLRFSADEQSVAIDFKGVKFRAVDSELSGGTWYQFSDEPEVFEIPYYSTQKPTVLVALPEAYIIPPEWKIVCDRLALHGVTIRRLEKPSTIEVDSYRFKNVSWRSRPYEGRHPVSFEVEPITEERRYPSGAFVVDMAQRAARAAAHVLEPSGPDSYVHWGFFDTIFEQKEYASSFVMEEMAREMLAEDPGLEREFEAKKADDPKFAGSSWAILNWFYQRSPYADDRMNVYPVGRILDRSTLDALPLR